MTFQLFGTTLKGIPEMDTLPPYYIMSSRFYMLSVALFIIFFILFSYITIFTFYRVIKKIYNPHVYEAVDTGDHVYKDEGDKKPVEQMEPSHKRNDGNDESVDPLGYHEDEKETKNFEDLEDQKKQKNKKDAKENDIDSDEDSDKDQDDENHVSDDESLADSPDETQQQIASKVRLFGYQDSLFKLAPWCLIFIYTLNNFTLDYISLVSVLIMIVCYVVFNMFNIAEAHPMLKNLYLLGALGGFVPHFINQQDFTI